MDEDIKVGKEDSRVRMKTAGSAEREWGVGKDSGEWRKTMGSEGRQWGVEENNGERRRKSGGQGVPAHVVVGKPRVLQARAVARLWWWWWGGRGGNAEASPVVCSGFTCGCR